MIKHLSLAYFVVASFISFNLTKQGDASRLTPVMGFNTWNLYRCDINESMVKGIADQLVSTNLFSFGYEYVNIDDCWSDIKGRDVSTDNIKADAIKFPHGIEQLSSYIHSKNLKFGMYSNAGTMTCAKYPGSLGYELLDAKLFIQQFDIDLLKYDYCFHRTKPNDPNAAQFVAYVDYQTMYDALMNELSLRQRHDDNTEFIFSMCSWGLTSVNRWGHMIGNSWRTTHDIFAFFDFKQRWEQCLNPPKLQWCHLSVMEIIDESLLYADSVSCGKFMDLDMLVVGFYQGMTVGDAGDWDKNTKIGGLTYIEQQTHFIFWCLFQSPLILGYDLKQLSKDVQLMNLITNKELIGINQDLICQPLKLIHTIATKNSQLYEFSIQIYVKHMKNDNIKYIAVLNRDYIDHFNVKIYLRWFMDEILKDAINDDFLSPHEHNFENTHKPPEHVQASKTSQQTQSHQIRMKFYDVMGSQNLNTDGKIIENDHNIVGGQLVMQTLFDKNNGSDWLKYVAIERILAHQTILYRIEIVSDSTVRHSGFNVVTWLGENHGPDWQGILFAIVVVVGFAVCFCGNFMKHNCFKSTRDKKR